MCGEEMDLLVASLSNTGSPPRVRGRVNVYAIRHNKPGITPACAGKRCASPNIAARFKDHPRVCGEELAKAQGEVLNKGSPPRVRGRVNHGFMTPFQDRITPACAGKSHALDCEELMDEGSPPRVRGRDTTTRPMPLYSRITPACAGKSHTAHSSDPHKEDHPRVCGEESK